VTVEVVAVVGATGTGKSALGVGLAEALGGEIVNTDSMQLYRGMDIGTAKISPGDRRGIPHHLLDIWDVDRAANVAEFQRLARAAVAEISSRGRLPILVGGSGLYLRAVIDDLRFPGTDPQVRAQLQRECDRVGSGALHARLAATDPAAAAAILPTNARRVIRALEVVEISGGPFRANLPDPRPVLSALTIGLGLPRDVLNSRLEERVDDMFAHGLVAEVDSLDGLRGSPTASRALGYRQVLAMRSGECELPQAVSDTVAATRRFARRQVSWFRRDPSVIWLDAADPQLLSAAMAVARRAGIALEPQRPKSTHVAGDD
jgi:tRNA dimethylallyltransferase